MKKRIVIMAMLIIINMAYTALIVFFALFSYAIIVRSIGHDRGLEMAYQVKTEILFKVGLGSCFVLMVNYLLFRFGIKSNRPLLASLFISSLTFLIFIPFLFRFEQAFIDFQDKGTSLLHYIDERKIEDLTLITLTDTLPFKPTSSFINKLGTTWYKPGIWKYQKTMKLIIHYKNGEFDSIMTNGRIFGPYKGYFFESNYSLFSNKMDVNINH